MATFNVQDFLTDDIPECLLPNTNAVKLVLDRVMPGHGTIQDIGLIGFMSDGILLHEWYVTILQDDELVFARLPVYLPKDPTAAEKLLQKHSLTSIDVSTLVNYISGEYLLIGYQYPCQLVSEEDGTLAIKRITMFASQKQVQDFLQQTLHCELVTAAMVVMNMHSLCYEGLGDIGWLLNMDGTPSLIDMDRRPIPKGLAFIDDFDELSNGSVFAIDSQYYIVDEDEENGQFIAKISTHEAKAIARVTSV